MRKVKGYHAMMLCIRGIKGITETRKQKGDTVYQCYKKGKEELALVVISLKDAKLNEYFAKDRF